MRRTTDTERTLTTIEMPYFYANANFDVGRIFGGKIAHIYLYTSPHSLCGDVDRRVGHTASFTPLSLYTAGDMTCSKCLRLFRLQTQQGR